MDDGRDEGRECRKVRRGVLEAIDRSRSLECGRAFVWVQLLQVGWDVEGCLR